jgi:hypothetical protein
LLNRKLTIVGGASLAFATAVSGGFYAATASAATASSAYAKVSDVAVSSVSATGFTVSWKNNGSYSGTTIRVQAYNADTKADTFDETVSGTSTSETVTGLAAGTAYELDIDVNTSSAHTGSGFTAPESIYTTAAVGTNGTVGDVEHNSFYATVPANSFGEVAATCDGTAFGQLPSSTNYPIGGNADLTGIDNDVAVGGGFEVGNGSGDVTGGVVETMSRPELTYTNGRGWLIGVDNTTSSPQTVYAYVVCVAAPDDNPAT